MAAETKKNKLLFVDDIPTNIKVLLEVLKDDYKIIFAQNGPEAVELAEKSQPDLILLDIMMPDMDGYAVCKQLKNNPETVSIPVILLTCKGEMKDMIMGIQEGAFDYITKPFNPDDLLKRVSFAIKKGGKKVG